LLNQEGYTVRGVQKLLRDRNDGDGVRELPAPVALHHPVSEQAEEQTGVDVFRLIALRNRLADALEH